MGLLINKIVNTVRDKQQTVSWYSDRLEAGGKTAYYDGIQSVGFLLKHEKHSTNAVTDNVSTSYEIDIDDIHLSRIHSSFNNVLQGTKDAHKAVEDEYSQIVEQLFERVIPGLFARKAYELATKGKVELVGVLFTADGTIIEKKKAFNIADCHLVPAIGGVIIDSKVHKTITGKEKTVVNRSMAASNACLIAPIFNLLS